MIGLLSLLVSAAADCPDLGLNCSLLENGWSGQCKANYDDWGSGQTDFAGVKLAGYTMGEVCPLSCSSASASIQGGTTKTCDEWKSSDLTYEDNGSGNNSVGGDMPTYTLMDGSIVYGECVPKPQLADSLLAAQSAQCVKAEVKYDESKCAAFQQYCDWRYTGFPSSTEYKRIPEHLLFAETADCTSGDCPQVDPSLHSANFGLFPPAKKDFFWHSLDTEGVPLPPRASKWVMWHYDEITSPVFELASCDCLEGARVEGPEGWFTNSDCDDICTRAAIGSEEKMSTVITVHDRVCHREVDVDGVRWDPSPNMNYLMPLDKVFPTRLGPGQGCPGDDCIPGLNMQRGEGGASWFWWSHAKNSWNENDQTSHTGPGEFLFETEHECQKYAESYWDVKDMDIKFHSVCDRFSSKTPCTDETGAVLVSNKKCAAACDGRNTEFDDWFISQGLIKSDGSATDSLVSWFHDNCVYTPYQPENDHAWPNFYVPDINQCFGQWQIGYEDQACDACMHPLYDNTDAFNGGWSYAPIEGFGVDASVEGFGNCRAQCGKFIMDGPGTPKDVKSAQECQNYCQEDPNCVAFQWRPSPDWDMADSGTWEANKFNQVRSCLLKNQAQVDGALRARWGNDGQWIWSPEEDNNAYANVYQNNDCAQGTTGEANSWCLGCRDTDGQITYHSWKWRNNMISGPKFCDTPKLFHGNTDRLDSPYFDSSVTPLTVSDCPAYEMGRDNPVAETTPDLVDLDGTPTTQYCAPKSGLENLNGGSEWAEYCEAANRKYDTESAKNYCEQFQQYCEWVMDFRIPSSDYKRLSESALGIATSVIEQNVFSSTFGLNPPCDEVCEVSESTINDPSLDGVCTPPETCDGQTSEGGYHNSLPSRQGGWVFWHPEKLGSISLLGCDCLEDPTCSTECDRIASDADVLTVHFLMDRVCHREEDVLATRWDPSPNMASLTDVFESEWGSLGMTDGESGSSWYWYGASKPSWNNWDQTSHVGPGEKVFATEYECRAYANSYWSNMGYPAFDSVCSQFSSVTPGISNAMCRAVCDGDDLSFEAYMDQVSDLDSFFNSHCVYTPYQAENDHAWPNTYVPDANECFGQWQIGYEDQGCDGCIHSQYDNTPDFDFGWSYAPVEGSSIPEESTGTEGEGTGVWNKGHCSAQCGKVITDGPGVFKDVKTAQECQHYCQLDSRCVAFQWRSTPDYTAAASIDQTGYVNENNRINKVRSCLLKSVDQVMGALEARWDESGNFVDNSSPDWDGESDWEAGAPYNEFSSGVYQINDSQNSQTGEGANWYLTCKDSSDFPNTAGTKTTHSWKWRNNMISGPKYCGAEGTGRIAHGATIPSSSFLTGKDTLTTCPTRDQITFGIDVIPNPASNPGASNEYPVLSDVAVIAAPEVEELYQPWKEPSTTTPEQAAAAKVPCDISSYSFCDGSAWENACLNAYSGSDLSVAGCAVHCADRVQYVLPGENTILTAAQWQTKFASYDAKYGIDKCVYDKFPYTELSTTSTTTTTPVASKISSCAYTTTTTTTTTEAYVEWTPACPDGGLTAVSNDTCVIPENNDANWSGYVVELESSRDGVFTSGNGTVTVTTPRPVPSWCKASVTALPAGTYDADEFYYQTGLMKLACVGWTEAKHSAAQSLSRGEPNCQEEAGVVFSYAALAKAVAYFPDFMGYDNLKQNQLDLASFLAHTGAETTGGSASNIYGFAWCFSHEQTRDPTRYGNQENMNCPSCETWGYDDMIVMSNLESREAENWGYYGRGALQLTYAYNYGAFQLWAEQNLAFAASDVDFMTNPGKVATEDFGFASSLWFFMSSTRQSDKPSMHNVVDGWIVDGELATFDNIDTDNVGRSRDFGYQMNILNGGLECNGMSHPGPAKRSGYFNYFIDKLGFEGDLTAVSSICKGCTMAPSIANSTAFQYWYHPTSGLVDGGDTATTCSGSGSVSGSESVNATAAPTTKEESCYPYGPWGCEPCCN